MSFKRKNEFTRGFFRHQKIIAFLGVFLIILIALPLSKNLNKKKQVDEEIAKLNKEIFDLDNKSKELSGLIDYLSSDQFAEKEARLSLGYKKPGEEVVIVKKPLINENSLNSDEEHDKNLSNPQRWWRYFFD